MASAWPMIERCLLAQWQGYGDHLRDLMDQEWSYANGNGHPGDVGATGSQVDFLWRVTTPNRIGSPSDYLITIKTDHWPTIDSEKLIIVGSDHADPQSPPPSADPRFR